MFIRCTSDVVSLVVAFHISIATSFLEHKIGENDVTGDFGKNDRCVMSLNA